MRKRACLAMALCLALTGRAGATAYTSSQSGNWSSASTWGGSGPPGNGDTATIATGTNVSVDVNTTVGTSLAAGTVVVTVNSTGTLAVNSGVTFTVRGDLVLNNTTLTLSSGSTYTFDSSAASGTPQYKITIANGTGQASAKLICNGASGSGNHVTINKATGSGNGEITSSSYSNVFQAKCTYTDFSNIGGTTNIDCVSANPGSGGEFTITNCTFTNCGRVYLAGINAAGNLTYQFNVHTGSLDSTSGQLRLVNTNPTTGLRLVTDNIFDENAKLTLQQSEGGITFDRNYVPYILGFQLSDTNPFADFQHNFCYSPYGTWSTFQIGVPGETLKNCYRCIDQRSYSSNAAGFTQPNYIGTTTSGTVTVQKFVYDVSNATGSSAEELLQDRLDDAANITAGLWTLLDDHGLVIPNSAGTAGSRLGGAHGSKFVRFAFSHCTLMLPELSNAIAGVLTGDFFIGMAGQVNQFQDCLGWTSIAPGGSYQFATSHYRPYNYSGTATSGTTTTLTDTTQSFYTTSGQTLGDAAAKLVITGGTGPAAGSSATITSNTATQVTFTPAFASAVNSTTTYLIMTPDIITSANVSNNAYFNANTGTIYDDSGGTATSVLAHDAWWVSSPATFDSGALNLGSGAYTGGNGPQFVDWTRNVATFDSAYLNNASSGGSVPATWASGQAYTVGQIVKAQSSGFYNNAVVNFRCITAHTSLTGDATRGQPGSAAATSYRNDWEFASVYSIRQAILAGTTYTDASLGLTGANVIQTLLAWVRAGFAPKNSLLKGAAHDATDIGAVPVATTATASPAGMRSGGLLGAIKAGIRTGGAH